MTIAFLRRRLYCTMPSFRKREEILGADEYAKGPEEDRERRSERERRPNESAEGVRTDGSLTRKGWAMASVVCVHVLVCVSAQHV